MNNRTNFRNYQVVIIAIMLIFAAGCKKTEDNTTPQPTPVPSTVTDIDGNIYHTVTIGTQLWMVENLRTTRLNDGTAIPLTTDNVAWGNLVTPGYCWFNNDMATFMNTYGALYNWFTVNTGKLAPAGWHVPTDADWTTLTDFLGGEDAAGGQMKSIGNIQSATGLWRTPNTGATNSSGFTALPGGLRYSGGTFGFLTELAYFWSASSNDTQHAWYAALNYNASYVTMSVSFLMPSGFSVRCLKN